MTATLVGYARCSTQGQDLAIQKAQLLSRGVPEDRIYFDQGLSGTRRARPGLDQALAAVREGDTLVVTALDRLARSVPDAHAVLNQLSSKGVNFQEAMRVYDWSNPVDRMLLSVLATVAAFQADLIRQRTREGMAMARAKGKLRGRQPKLSTAKQKHLLDLHAQGEASIAALAHLFDVSRPTVYRVIARAAANAGGSSAAPDDAQPFRASGDQVPTPQPEADLPTRREAPEPLSARLHPLGPPEVAPPAKTSTPEDWAADWAAADDEAHDQFLYVEGLSKRS